MGQRPTCHQSIKLTFWACISISKLVRRPPCVAGQLLLLHLHGAVVRDYSDIDLFWRKRSQASPLDAWSYLSAGPPIRNAHTSFVVLARPARFSHGVRRVQLRVGE